MLAVERDGGRLYARLVDDAPADPHPKEVSLAAELGVSADKAGPRRGIRRLR